jgi:hypothetical protein
MDQCPHSERSTRPLLQAAITRLQTPGHTEGTSRSRRCTIAPIHWIAGARAPRLGVGHSSGHLPESPAGSRHFARARVSRRGGKRADCRQTAPAVWGRRFRSTETSIPLEHALRPLLLTTLQLLLFWDRWLIPEPDDSRTLGRGFVNDVCRSNPIGQLRLL